MAFDSDLDIDGGSDDEDLAPTQVAPPPPRATLDTSAATVDERVLCAICSMNLSLWTIQDRAVHMNACLDATTMQTKYECPTCSKDLTDYNEQRRAAHVNICLDRLDSSSAQSHNGDTTATASSASAASRHGRDDTASTPPAAALSGPPSHADAYSCMICGVDLTTKDLTARIRHVKQCGQRHGVRPSDVAALQATEPPVLQEGQLSVTGSERASDRVSDADADARAVADESDYASRSTGIMSANAFTLMMRASSSSSSSSSVLSGTIGRVGQAVSNAFDVLMKSSKTQAVASAATSSGAPPYQSTQPRFGKKRRLWSGGAPSSTSASTHGAAASSARRSTCPDFKRIKGTQPSFIVDGFRYASKALSSVYFLTHFHSDHYTGLDKSFDCGIIYCNAVTAALVVQELRIDAKWVHPVPMNTPVVLHDTTVTFMDANHCPGAAIILFRLKNGQTYLHTGDFRYDRKMLAYAPLQPYLPPADGAPRPVLSRLDGIYLDTTYADPKYVFPTQQAAIEHTLALVAKHSLSDKVLYLFGSYSIGKERLFMEVARTHSRKVCVSKAKLKFIATFGWPEAEMKLLTTETSATNLHVVPMNDLKMEHLIALLAKHRLRFRQIVAFRPTGWTFSKSSQSLSTCRTDASGNVRIYGVPYSEHSSFAELAEFVQVMDPHVIIPTVNCHSEKAVKKQVDALRQVAFRSIASLLVPQQQQ